MSLSATQRARFARHILLPEIGVAGQVRLCNASLLADANADTAAQGVARDYLERAGVTWIDDTVTTPTTPPTRVNLPPTAAVDALAPVALRHAACAFSGAFAAVETIKRIVGAGQAAELVADFSLISEKP